MVVGPFPFQKAIIADLKLLADFCSLLACLKEYKFWSFYLPTFFNVFNLWTYIKDKYIIDFPLAKFNICQSTFVEVFLGCMQLRAASYTRNFNCLSLKFIAKSWGRLLADIRLSKVCNICPLICSLEDWKLFLSCLFVFLHQAFHGNRKNPESCKSRQGNGAWLHK